METRIKLLVLAIISLFMFMYVFDSKLDMNGDNFVYMLTSKQIAADFSYSNIDGSVAYWFPWGYPTFLALLSVIGDSPELFKMVNGLLMMFSVFLIYLTRKDNLSFAAAICFVFHPAILRNATTVMSEPLFIAMSMVAILMLNKNYIIAAVLAGLSMHVRGVGLALIGALFLYHLWHKQWAKSAISLVVSILVYAPLMIRNKMAGVSNRFTHSLYADNIWRENNYVEGIDGLIDKVFNNFVEYSNAFVTVFYNQYQPSEHFNFFGLILVSAILYGLYRYSKIGLFYFISTMGILLLFHGGNGIRYLIPVIPFMLIGFFGFVKDIVAVNNSEKYLNYVYAFTALVVVVLNLSIVKNHHIQANSNLHPVYRNYINDARQASLLQSQNNVDITVMTRKPEIFSYYSGLKAYRYPYTTDVSKYHQALLDKQVNVLHIDELPYSSKNLYLIPLVQKTQKCYTGLYQQNKSYLLGVDVNCIGAIKSK